MKFLLTYLSHKEGLVKSFCEKLADKLKVWKTFFDAARDDCNDKLEECLSNAGSDAERHFLMSATDDFGSSALHIAAKHDNAFVFEFLIKQKVPMEPTRFYVNQRDSRGRTPLFYLKNEETFIKFLDIIVEGCDAPIHIAAEKGFVNSTKKLLEKGAAIDFQDNEYGRTPLGLAAEKGHKEICSFLLDKGASVNSVDATNRTALHFAALNGHEEICSLLLARKPDASIVDKYNKSTALNLALKFNHTNIVSLLSEYKY